MQAINDFYFMDNSADGKSSMLNQAVESSYEQNEGDTFSPQSKKTSASAELSLDKLIAKAGEAPVIKLVESNYSSSY